MLNPISISETLLYTTVRLENSKGIGTGFFYGINIDDKSHALILITNKHVCNEEKSFDLRLHYLNDDDILSDGIFTLNLKDLNIIEHPVYDLCCFEFGGFINQIKNDYNKRLFYKMIINEHIWDDSKLLELMAVEDIVMFGYPIGLYDEVNVLPLIRKGITASHPAIDFNGKSIGVIDAACFPGSSGSPIFIMNENMVPHKSGNVSLMRRLIFLGILFSGPVYHCEGKIVVKDIPTTFGNVPVTEMMTNLGYYIKAKEIFKLVEIFKIQSNNF